MAFILLAFNVHVYRASTIVHSRPSFLSVKSDESLAEYVLFLCNFWHLWSLLCEPFKRKDILQDHSKLDLESLA